MALVDALPEAVKNLFPGLTDLLVELFDGIEQVLASSSDGLHVENFFNGNEAGYVIYLFRVCYLHGDGELR